MYGTVNLVKIQCYYEVLSHKLDIYKPYSLHMAQELPQNMGGEIAKARGSSGEKCCPLGTKGALSSLTHSSCACLYKTHARTEELLQGDGFWESQFSLVKVWYLQQMIPHL